MKKIFFIIILMALNSCAGTESDSNDQPIITHIRWIETSGGADFSPRTEHTSVVFDNKIWVIGGSTTDGLSSEVWYSTDGQQWILATSSGFPPRKDHTSVVFDNKIWVIGGIGGISGVCGSVDGLLNDVWYSTDGKNWSESTNDAAFSPRYSHTSIVFDDRMWVISGQSCAHWKWYLGGVFYSEDGNNWNSMTLSGELRAMTESISVVFQNQIWVFPGSQLGPGETYSSPDGITWSLVSSHQTDVPYNAHTIVAFENYLWLVGVNEDSVGYGETWYSIDGITWTEADAEIKLPERRRHTSVVFDNKIWVIGGDNTEGKMNDVWYFVP